MALEPATVIKRLPNRDPIEPGFERTSLAKTFYAFEGFEKDFLGAVCRIRRIKPTMPENEVEDRGVIVGDQAIERRFRAGLQLGNQCGFVTAHDRALVPIRQRGAFLARKK